MLLWNVVTIHSIPNWIYRSCIFSRISFHRKFQCQITHIWNDVLLRNWFHCVHIKLSPHPFTSSIVNNRTCSGHKLWPLNCHHEAKSPYIYNYRLSYRQHMIHGHWYKYCDQSQTTNNTLCLQKYFPPIHNTRPLNYQPHPNTICMIPSYKISQLFQTCELVKLLLTNKFPFLTNHLNTGTHTGIFEIIWVFLSLFCMYAHHGSWVALNNILLVCNTRVFILLYV